MTDQSLFGDPLVIDCANLLPALQPVPFWPTSGHGLSRSNRRVAGTATVS